MESVTDSVASKSGTPGRAPDSVVDSVHDIDGGASDVMESVTDSVIASLGPHVEDQVPAEASRSLSRCLIDPFMSRVVHRWTCDADTVSFALGHLGEREATMHHVNDEGARARAALESALVGLLADLRRHWRDDVVSLGVVGVTGRMSAILGALSSGTVGQVPLSDEPAERLVSARAAVVFLVGNAEALDLSAQLLLLLARAAHVLSAAERVLLPGCWEAR